MKVGIIGLGFVGGSMLKSFSEKKIDVIGYDKYKNINVFDDILESEILFLCLPTPYSNEKNKYNYEPIEETLLLLKEKEYKGVIVLKSTIQPEMTNILEEKYNIGLIHNPEFLTARTAYEDFHNQKHIVLGRGNKVLEEDYKKLIDFYRENYSDNISLCSSLESESMKIYLNSFYAIKVEVFTEFKMLCDSNGSDYNRIRDMMLKNGWINEMHTNVPGVDGKISYGGLCFPKDTNALNKYMEEKGVLNMVLESCIKERNLLREDNDNII